MFEQGEEFLARKHHKKLIWGVCVHVCSQQLNFAEGKRDDDGEKL